MKAFPTPGPMRALVLSLIVLAGCTVPRPSTSGGVPAVEWGSSFGMCAGYCVTRLAVSPDGTATLTETGNRSDGLAPRVRSRVLTAPERTRLAEATTASTLTTEVRGCPDCADGGAEYVERDGARVTFEYGGDAGAAAPLAVALRAIRETFPRPE